MAGRTRTIRVEQLARVEGEGALYVKVRGRRVERVELRIFEPPRLFEALLRGRAYTEAADITARICGICPVAYQMSAVHAIERVLGVALDAPLRALRRILYCGEWIESHVLHIHMLHAPDFLGYPDAIHMAKDHPEVVRRGLRLKKAGNEIVRVLGGREIHPINVRVGGFYRVPTRAELAPLIEELRWARDAALEIVRWSATLPLPEVSCDWELVALRHPDEYPMNAGRVASSGGLDVDAEELLLHVEEHQVEHSNALHARLRGRGPYLVGPLARFALNHERLTPLARAAARDAGLVAPCRNPFQSIVVRSVEVLHAVDVALELLAAYTRPKRPWVDAPPRAGVGAAATEAPRGLLLHRYELDADGRIADARIVPPTSQNQASIELDLVRVVEASLDLEQAELTARCEQAIRNHDPCISCATHFLALELDLEGG